MIGNRSDKDAAEDYDQAARGLHSAAQQLEGAARALRAEGQSLTWERSLGKMIEHMGDVLTRLGAVHEEPEGATS